MALPPLGRGPDAGGARREVSQARGDLLERNRELVAEQRREAFKEVGRKPPAPTSRSPRR